MTKNQHPRGFFVTGTDTGVGKTLVAAALVRELCRGGVCAVGMKPVASDCRATPEGLRNGDAETLIAASDGAPPYDQVNPYAFAPAVAPHLAAAAAGVSVDLDLIGDRYARLAAGADAVVVEGVGGWAVPLGPALTVADLARGLGLPVVLVVGLRLGCLNHALLTAEAIDRSGVVLAGWVANRIDPDMALVEENIQALQERLAAPLIGVIPVLEQGRFDDVTSFLQMKMINRK